MERHIRAGCSFSHSQWPIIEHNHYQLLMQQGHCLYIQWLNWPRNMLMNNYSPQFCDHHFLQSAGYEANLPKDGNKITKKLKIISKTWPIWFSFLESKQYHTSIPTEMIKKKNKKEKNWEKTEGIFKEQKLDRRRVQGCATQPTSGQA